MNKLARRILTSVAASFLISACGGSDGADTRSQAVAGSVRDNDECQLLQFDSVESFTSNDYLFFSFEYPKGWIHLPAASGLAGHGYLQNPENQFVQIEYILWPTPTAVDGPIVQILESTGGRLEPIVYGGVDVRTYGALIGRNATLEMVLPHGDDYYKLNLNFHGRKDCDDALIEHLRTTVLRSLLPNPSTSFNQ